VAPTLCRCADRCPPRGLISLPGLTTKRFRALGATRQEIALLAQTKKKPPCGGFFFVCKQIIAWLARRQQVLRVQQQERLQEQQELQQQELLQVQELLLFYRKQPGQQQR
jgi:hypothetical protein